jgi:hypothetical protein
MLSISSNSFWAIHVLNRQSGGDIIANIVGSDEKGDFVA